MTAGEHAMPTTYTKTITLYQFDELTYAAKEKARDWWRECGIDDDWHECVDEDAANVGIKITGFDCGRGNSITGDFDTMAVAVANKIIAGHGKDCDTFKTATAFIAERMKLVADAPRNPDDHEDEFTDEAALDDAINDLETEFKRAILEDYLSMLRRELEYQQSDEYIDETIRGNEYTFDENGKRED